MGREDAAPLDELRLTVVVDNEPTPLSSIDEGVPQLPEVADLLRRLPTAPDLNERIHPRVVVPGHRTGWRAKAALARAVAPGSHGPSVVGSRYVLTAPGD